MTHERKRRVIESTWPDVAHEAIGALMAEDGDDAFFRKYWTNPEDVLRQLDEHTADDLFFQDFLLKHRSFLRKDAVPPFVAEDFGEPPGAAIFVLEIRYAHETARRTAWNRAPMRPDGTDAQVAGRSSAGTQPKKTAGVPIAKITTTCHGMWPPPKRPKGK